MIMESRVNSSSSAVKHDDPKAALKNAETTWRQVLRRVTTGLPKVLDDAQRLQEENGALKDKLDSLIKRGIELEYQHSEAQQLDKKQIAALTVANEQAQAQLTAMKVVLKENETRKTLSAEIQDSQVSELFLQLKEVNLKNCCLEQELASRETKDTDTNQKELETQEKLQQLTSQCDELRATVNNNNQALEVVESLAHSLRQQLQQSAELNDNGNVEIAKLRKENAQLEKSISEATAALEVNDAANANANQQNDVSTQKTSESKEHWLQVIKLLRVEAETHRVQMLEMTQHLKESTQALDAQVALNATRLDRIAELTGELRSNDACGYRQKPIRVAPDTNTAMVDTEPRCHDKTEASGDSPVEIRCFNDYANVRKMKIPDEALDRTTPTAFSPSQTDDQTGTRAHSTVATPASSQPGMTPVGRVLDNVGESLKTIQKCKEVEQEPPMAPVVDYEKLKDRPTHSQHDSETIRVASAPSTPLLVTPRLNTTITTWAAKLCGGSLKRDGETEVMGSASNCEIDRDTPLSKKLRR